MPDNIFELLCELCGGGHHEDQIILCDHCDRGCHLFCLTPPLDAVPEGEWVCPLCRAADAASGAFREGQECSLADFERIANDFKVNTFGSESAARKVRRAPSQAGPCAARTLCGPACRPRLLLQRVAARTWVRRRSASRFCCLQPGAGPPACDRCRLGLLTALLRVAPVWCCAGRARAILCLLLSPHLSVMPSERFPSRLCCWNLCYWELPGGGGAGQGRYTGQVGCRALECAARLRRGPSVAGPAHMCCSPKTLGTLQEAAVAWLAATCLLAQAGLCAADCACGRLALGE